MKTLKYISIVILLTVLSSSCSEDWLEIEQKGSSAQEDYYTTDDECISALTSIYDEIQAFNAQDWESLFHEKTLLSDEVNAGGASSSDNPEYHELNEYSFIASNTKVYAAWKGLYYAIYRANVVLENVKGETAEQVIILAEAKALRAYLYFEVVNLFGQAPLITETPKSSNDYLVKKTSVDSIYAQIETDLTEAIPDLQEEDITDNTDWRIKKGFAQALMGKVLIFQEKYSDALPYLQAVIESGDYGLEDDYSRIIRYDTEFGKESLFEISYSAGEGFNWDNYPWDEKRAQENNIHWILCGPRSGYFEGGSLEMFGGWGAAPPKQLAYNFFNSDDPRRGYNMISEDSLIALGGSMRDASGDLQHEGEGFIRLKYTTWTDEASSDDGAIPGLNIGTNIRIMRYAEVLLLAAEAYVQTGDGASAATEINKVRARPSVNYTKLATATMDDVKYERRCELCFEGHRFFDLIRWGDAESTLGSLGFTSKYEKFPIPQSEIDANPNLVQNDPWK